MTQYQFNSTDWILERGRFQADIIHAKVVNRRACIEENLIGKDSGDFKMTPQEELFAKFFNGEKADPKVRELVAAKDTIGLRARRDELSQISFEARARATAIDDEIRSINGGTGPKGFERSINSDDTTSDAINAINNRAKRLDKKEKIRQNLLEMGVDPAEVDKIMSNKGIADLSKTKESPAAAKVVTSKAGSPMFNWDKIMDEAKAKQAAANLETPKSTESVSVNSNPFSFLKKE